MGRRRALSRVTSPEPSSGPAAHSGRANGPVIREWPNAPSGRRSHRPPCGMSQDQPGGAGITPDREGPEPTTAFTRLRVAPTRDTTRDPANPRQPRHTRSRSARSATRTATRTGPGADARRPPAPHRAGNFRIVANQYESARHHPHPVVSEVDDARPRDAPGLVDAWRTLELGLGSDVDARIDGGGNSPAVPVMGGPVAAGVRARPVRLICRGQAVGCTRSRGGGCPVRSGRVPGGSQVCSPGPPSPARGGGRCGPLTRGGGWCGPLGRGGGQRRVPVTAPAGSESAPASRRRRLVDAAIEAATRAGSSPTPMSRPLRIES